MENGITTTTPNARAHGWPAITVLVVQLGLQWMLAQQIVMAGWASGNEFLPLFTSIAVITTAITVWIWRADSLIGLIAVVVVGMVALIGWIAPLVHADVTRTLGASYATRLDGYIEISYELILHAIRWWHHIQTGQPSSDALMFVVVLAILSYLLAVVSTWVLLNDHAVWLSLTLSALPLLANYAFAPQSSATSIGVFVGGALVLVALNQIDWHEVIWHQNQVDRAHQTATRLLAQSIGIIGVALAIATLLPIPSRDARIVASWNTMRTPLSSLQKAWAWVLGSGTTPAPAGAVIGGFTNTSMTVGGARNLGQTEILRFRSSAPDYLRATTFDWYTGQGWNQSAHSYAAPLDANTLLTLQQQTTAFVQSEISMTIPQSETMLLSIGQPIAYNVAVTVTHLADLAIDDNSIVAINGGAIQQYQLVSNARTASSEELRNAPAPIDDMRTIYTALPATLPPRISAYAQNIVATAQATTAYDQALAIQTTLRRLRYDEQRPAPPATSDWVEYFLFTGQRGYCDDFATAMVVLLRTQAIPARLAQGYAIGTPDGTGGFIVRAVQAHSWVEVYFQGYGWQRFEPTPADYTTERSLAVAPVVGATSVVATPGFTAVVPTFLPNKTPLPEPTATVASAPTPRQRIPLPTVPGWIWWLLGGTGLMASSGIVWWQSRTIAQHIRMQYTGICWLYRLHGLPLAVHTTANDVAQLTATMLPLLDPMIGTLCTAYNQLQYAGQPATQVPRVAWHTVCWQLWLWRWRIWRHPPQARS